MAPTPIVLVKAPKIGTGKTVDKALAKAAVKTMQAAALKEFKKFAGHAPVSKAPKGATGFAYTVTLTTLYVKDKTLMCVVEGLGTPVGETKPTTKATATRELAGGGAGQVVLLINSAMKGLIKECLPGLKSLGTKGGGKSPSVLLGPMKVGSGKDVDKTLAKGAAAFMTKSAKKGFKGYKVIAKAEKGMVGYNYSATLTKLVINTKAKTLECHITGVAHPLDNLKPRFSSISKGTIPGGKARDVGFLIDTVMVSQMKSTLGSMVANDKKK